MAACSLLNGPPCPVPTLPSSGVAKPAAATPNRRSGRAGAGARRPAPPHGAGGEAFQALVAADVAELVEMGFTAAQAREALEETGFCGANAAANWLAVHLL